MRTFAEASSRHRKSCKPKKKESSIASGVDRKPDLSIFSAALSRLSYRGDVEECGTVKLFELLMFPGPVEHVADTTWCGTYQGTKGTATIVATETTLVNSRCLRSPGLNSGRFNCVLCLRTILRHARAVQLSPADRRFARDRSLTGSPPCPHSINPTHSLFPQTLHPTFQPPLRLPSCNHVCHREAQRPLSVS